MSSVDEAVAALGRGELVVLPTDTVYGVAGRLEVHTIDALFALKERPYDKPLPVLGGDVGSLSELAVFDDRATSLAQRHWPGPLTLVLPRAEGFGLPLGRGGEGSVAVRVPAHPLSLELLGQTGPVAVTSANRSGESEARTVAEARTALGDGVSIYLDGGPCEGEPSTVVSLVHTTADIIRGGATVDDIVAQLDQFR